MTFASSLALALAAAAGLRDAAAFVAPASPSLSVGGASTREPLAAAPLHHQHQRRRHMFPIFSTTSTEELESEVKSMRVKEIKSELESYGISTRSFLEKGELVDALVQARAEGKTPMSTTVTPVPSPASSAPPAAAPTADREERVKTELEKCKEMKTSELKSELEALGVSTKSFFEKGEFVKALAEARVDGVKKSKKKKRRESVDDEVEEVKAKVEVITSDSVGPKTKKSRDGSSGDAGGSPFGGGAGGSPFGGGGGMGGMDMGGIADMLKGMGGMGGAAGANPFGGAGGSPFGAAAGGTNPFGGAGGGSPFGGAGMPGMEDAMKAMSNPKVQAVMAKAQKNPKVMQAVQESMGNPANMMKYMSDPEVGPILKELQEAMMG